MVEPSEAEIVTDDLVFFLKKNLQYREIRQHILKQAVVQQVAQSRGVSVTSDEIQAQADQIRREQRLERASDTLNWLADQQITPEEWEAGIRDSLLQTKLKEALFGSEVEQVFIENRINFDQVSLYQIVVPYGQLAQELFYQIEEREISFFEAAHLYDIDPKRRQNCGYEGKLYRWSLPPEVAAIVFGASSGELLRPIPLQDNHHIILVDQLIEAELSDELRTEILDNLFAEWMQGELNYLLNH